MVPKAAYWTVLLAMAAGPVLADADDPPSRVARLNYQSGTVSFRPGSVEEWTAATLNYPLTTGDHLWTEGGAQTEMHIGSTAVRMDSQTALSILNLDDRTVQLSVTQGAVNVHIRDLAPDEAYEIDTPNAAISLLRPGDYRIDCDGDRNLTAVTVWDGEAEFTAGDGGLATPVRAGQSARVNGIDQVTQEIVRAAGRGDFERWCEARDRREDRVESARHVSRGTIGYEDLDEYGAWREYPPYGWVWGPRVAAGWAPYRYGHWAWVDPWGWTWIDDAPWGFAPFHYGRWAYAGGGWFWVPGAMVARPVYAPALVAFVGGPAFGVSVSIGGGGPVGWFPLGPREVYRPAYRVSEGYVRQVNFTHVNVTNINVTNVRYVNQGVRGAVTVVPHDDFIHARPMNRSAVAVEPGVMMRAQVVGTAAPFAPVRDSVLGRADRPRTGAPPPRYADRAVVARRPPPPPRVSFGAQQRALEGNQGRPLDTRTLDGLRRESAPRGPVVRTVRPTPGGNAPARPAGGRPPNGMNDARPEAAPPVRPALPRNDRPARPIGRQDQPPVREQPREQPRNADRPRTAPPPAVARPNNPPNNQAAPRPEKQERKAEPQTRRPERGGPRRSDKTEEKK